MSGAPKTNREDKIVGKVVDILRPEIVQAVDNRIGLAIAPIQAEITSIKDLITREFKALQQNKTTPSIGAGSGMSGTLNFAGQQVNMAEVEGELKKIFPNLDVKTLLANAQTNQAPQQGQSGFSVGQDGKIQITGAGGNSLANPVNLANLQVLLQILKEFGVLPQQNAQTPMTQVLAELQYRAMIDNYQMNAHANRGLLNSLVKKGLLEQDTFNSYVQTQDKLYSVIQPQNIMSNLPQQNTQSPVSQKPPTGQTGQPSG